MVHSNMTLSDGLVNKDLVCNMSLGLLIKHPGYYQETCDL